MGVSSLTNRVAYSGDGSSTSFPFGYYFFSQTDLKVFLFDTVAKGITQQTLGTNYSISGTPNFQGLYPTGANVVMNVAPIATNILIIVRSPAMLQNFTLLQNGVINSAALVQELDYLTLLIQRLEDQVSRSAILADGFGDSFSSILPSYLALNPSCALIVNSSGNGFDVGPSTAGINNAATYAAQAASSASNAAASATTAQNAATATAGSVSAAATSATAAATSATNAAGSATSATAQAVAASSSATNAATSATNAASSAASAAASLAPNVVGTRTSPTLITAAGGIPFSGTNWNNIVYVKGSGGPVIVSANPQIAPGNAVGQRLELFSVDDTNTVEIQDGNGTDMNGMWIGVNGGRIGYEWDGSLWSETYRR